MGDFLFSLPACPRQDFSEQNAENAALWGAFEEGRHKRVPVRMNTNPRMLMLDPAHNTRGITYEQYMTDPDTMARAVLEWQYWLRHVLPGDHEHGLPEAWPTYIDFQNIHDAAWFGAPVHYRDGQVPDTAPILDDGRKRMLFDQSLPDPFGGEWAERALAYLDHFERKHRDGWTFLGRPVAQPTGSPLLNCDGIFTVAASLRGATELCLDLLTDPDYVHELLRYICDALVARMRAWREKTGIPVPCDNFGTADDAIQLLSPDQYREFVLPLHRAFFDAFGTEKGRAIHLCGNAQRHFKTLHDKLGVQAFDTGFPVDFSSIRVGLGLDILVSGGPRISFFLDDRPGPIVAETERILKSGVLEGGRFILQEANNLPPEARIETCRAFYEAGRKWGKL